MNPTYTHVEIRYWDKYIQPFAARDKNQTDDDIKGLKSIYIFLTKSEPKKIL